MENKTNRIHEKALVKNGIYVAFIINLPLLQLSLVSGGKIPGKLGKTRNMIR